MNRKLKLAGLAVLAVSFGTAACDLSTTNPNEPDRERALAAAADVEALIGSAYSQYFSAAQHYSNGLGPGTEVTADHNTSSWGNFGMRDLGEEPRKPFNNNPSYTYSYINEDHWGNNYDALTAASDGIRAIEAGLEIGPGGERNPRAMAFGRFMQGLGLGVLALFYDKAFVIDENTDPEEDLATVPYTEVANAALQRLGEAYQLATSNTFTLPPGWLNGNELSSDAFARVIKAYTARIKANMGRDPSERAAADWSGIMADVQAGIQEDLAITGTQTGPWWSGIKTLAGSDPGWTRVDHHWVGQADVSGGYQAWLNTPVQNRQPFNIQSPDLRLPQNPGTDEAAGSKFVWYTSTLLPPGRGTYHLGHYHDATWDAYYQSCPDFCWFGPIPDITFREMRLIEAEAHIRTGNPAAAADIINETRTAAGLPAVTTTGTSGSNCVPRKRLDPAGTCGDLTDALQYEHYMEVSQVSAGVTWLFTRGHGELVPGTVLHFPIPGQELETLQMDIYTFGGDAGGAAGQPSMAVMPSPDMTLQEALERVDYARRQLAREAESMSRRSFLTKQ